MKSSCWRLRPKHKNLFVRLYSTKKNNGQYFNSRRLEWLEAVAQRCCYFLSGVADRFWHRCSCKFCEISKNSFFQRTPPVPVSEWFTARALQDQSVLSNFVAVIFSFVCFEISLLVAGLIFNSYKLEFVPAINKQCR